jgi:hypothetical protein
MNAADGVAGNGTGVRGLQPGKMLVEFVGHSARRFNERVHAAASAPAHGPTEKALAMLEERKASILKDMPSGVVSFQNATKTSAKIMVGKDPARERAVNISPHAPKCECGAFEVESFPCGCMAIVADKAGENVLPLLHVTETNEFLKRVYTGLPEFNNPGTEFLRASTGAQVPADKPLAPGRPSNKRKKSAMDAASFAAYKARHPEA